MSRNFLLWPVDLCYFVPLFFENADNGDKKEEGP